MYKLKVMPEYLYHLTSKKNLDYILNHGLDPQYSKSSLPATFLALYEDIARQYESFYEDTEETVLLKIKTTFLKEEDLGPDNYELKDYLESNKTKYQSWEDVPYFLSLKFCGQVAYYGIIPPEAITY